MFYNVVAEATKENCEPNVQEVDDILPEAQTDNVEKPLEGSVLEILGEDPSISKSLSMSIHPTFLQRWKYWITNGVPEKDKQELLNKYTRPEELEAPVLNPEIIASLGESGGKRDSYRRETQLLAGSALTAIGAVLTLCSQEEEAIDKMVILERLVDAAKIITILHHGQSECRKAFITPGLSKEVKTILQNTTLNKFLFGDNLGEKIKEGKALERMGQTLKVQTQEFSRPSTSRHFLNFRGPWRGRPPLNRRGHTYTLGQARPQLFFKNRNPQRPHQKTQSSQGEYRNRRQDRRR